MQAQPRLFLRWFSTAAYWASVWSTGGSASRSKLDVSASEIQSKPTCYLCSSSDYNETPMAPELSGGEALVPGDCNPVPGGAQLGKNQGCTYHTIGSMSTKVLYETKTVKLYQVTLDGNTDREYIYKRFKGHGSASTLETLRRVLTWKCVKDGSPLFLPLDLHPTVHVSSSWSNKKHDGRHTYLGHIMEAMTGDMNTFAQEHDISQRAEEFESVADALISAAKCMHANGYTHMDIKPPNVFYHDDGAGIRWVLADYDDMVAEGTVVKMLGHYVTPTELLMQLNASLAEEFGDTVGSRSSDMYQIGNSLAHLLRGRSAFMALPSLPPPGVAYPGLEQGSFRDSDTYTGKKWKEDLVKGLTRCSEFPDCSTSDEQIRQIVADFFYDHRTRDIFKETGLESPELVEKLQKV